MDKKAVRKTLFGTAQFDLNHGSIDSDILSHKHL
jgi:hypothetical protein